MKKLDEATIKPIISEVASGNSIHAVAEKHDVRDITVSNLIGGKTHTDITGLTETENGVKYLRSNAEKFGGTPMAITPTTRKAKTKSAKSAPAKVKVVSVEQRMGHIIAESGKILTELDQAIEQHQKDADKFREFMEASLRMRDETYAKRQYWESIANTLSAPAPVSAE